MKNLRKNLKSKKGFTLIELIVVIVILAILMAIMLPSLTGYIDQANEQAILTEARNVYAALQTMNGLEYGTGVKYFNGANLSITADPTGSMTGVEKLNALIGVPATTYTTSNVTDIDRTGNTVVGFKLAKDGRTVTYAGSKFTVTTP